jgi:hypothetical protein
MRLVRSIALAALVCGFSAGAFGQTVVKGDFVLRNTYGETVLIGYTGSNPVVNIPANLGIAQIGESVFANSGITSLTIPEGVRIIGRGAFFHCINLASVTMSGVITIGEYAFRECSGLKSVTIPASVTAIGYGAFFGCNGLTSVIIPASVASIGEYAFFGCNGLKSVTIPASVASIGEAAFAGCNGPITVDPRNTAYSSIDGVLFDKAGKTLIKCSPAGKSGAYAIPSSVTVIEKSAFQGCNGLTSVIIPASVTAIREAAFAGCSGLTSVTIPASVTAIEQEAFSYCSGPITVDPRNTAYSSIDGVLFDKAGKMLIQCPIGKTGAYITPASVTSIGERAFQGCNGLTSVIIPASVTSIGDIAFYGCSGLTSVTIPSSVLHIGSQAFTESSSLKAVILSRKTRVGSNAFPAGVQLVYID